MINNAKTGFTVWCEADYFNCHEGSPSGQSIPNAGLQLGSPSSCEGGGFGGSSGGGCETSPGGCGGGGTHEGGWRPCESLPGGCDGEPKPWTPPGFDKPAAKPQCYLDPATGKMWFGNASIKGWTQLPKSDCESKGLHPGEWSHDQQHPSTGGDFSGDQGDTGGFGDHRGEWGGNGDYMGDMSGEGGREGGDHSSEDKAQLEREKKDMARNMSQRAREVKDMRRSLKDSRSDNAALASKIDQFEQSIAGVTNCFANATSFDSMQDCHDRNNDLNDLTQDIWSALQAGNVGRDLKNQERELKDMAREIARLEREDRDTSQLNSILEEIKSTQAEVLNLLNNDPDEAQYRMQDLGDLKRDFWDAIQEANSDEQQARMQKDLERGCKDFEREAKRAPKELRSEVEELLAECKTIVAQALSDLKSGAEPWEVEENMRDMQDLWPRFQEIMESQWSGNDCRMAERGLDEAERAIEHEAPDIIDEVRDENPAVAGKMETLLDKAEAILNQARADLASDDCASAMNAMDTLHHDISARFDALMREAGIEDDFEDDDHGYVDYDSFADDLDLDFDRDELIGRFKDNNYDFEDLGLIQRIAAEVLQQYFASQKDSGAPDILGSLSALGVSTADVQSLLETKNALLAEINALRTEIQGLKAELVAIADEVGRFTFGEETAKEAEKFVTNELPYLEPEEAEERWEEIQEAAGEELYDDGIIPFEDTPVGEWYTDDAQQARDLGLVEGTGESDGTELNPTGETNIAEALTMFARLSGGIDEDAVPTSDIGTSLPEWAESAAGTLEDAGIDLDEIFDEDTEAADPITREQVAILLDAVIDLPESDLDLTHTFSDIADASADGHDAIAAVYEAGIMGQDIDEFRPDDSLNRAELVTVLNRTHEEFGEGDHE